MTTFDVAVLGGGPGGYATALRASAHGLRVAIVEAGLVGGTCLHRGCVPSKALLHVAHLADQTAESVDLGLSAPGPGLDLVAARQFRDDVVNRLHFGLAGLLRSRGIEVIDGFGEITDAGTIAVRTADARSEVTAHHVVLATGSTVAQLPSIPFDHEVVISSDDALQLARIPERAIVVGAGAVGVEFASLWCSLGADVVLLETATRMLPLEDPDSSAAVTGAFRRRGIDVRTATEIATATRRGDAIHVELADGSPLVADTVLVAVGRRPASGNLGLERLGLLDQRGYVRIDPFGRTAIDGLWAVGDLVPTISLAHAAFAEGFTVADEIAGLHPPAVDHRQIPRVTYCRPEVASVGLTEPEARHLHGDNVRTTVVPFAGNARAVMERADGQVKLVVAGDGTMLGAHIVGPAATELIGEAALATSWEALAHEVGAVSHAHPTFAESIREAALAISGTPFRSHEPSPQRSMQNRTGIHSAR